MDVKFLPANNDDSDQTAQMHVTAQVSVCFDSFYLLFNLKCPYFRTYIPISA